MTAETIQLCKLRKSGQSLITTIKKDIIRYLDLKANDEVWINVAKAEKPVLVNYQCKACKHIFSQLNDDQNYCPACDCEDIDELTNTHTQELKGGDK